MMSGTRARDKVGTEYIDKQPHPAGGSGVLRFCPWIRTGVLLSPHSDTSPQGMRN